MRVLIRTDASFHIGAGHVMRCLALADELKRNDVHVLFVCRNQPGNLISLIRSKGYEVCSLPEPDLSGIEDSGADPPYANWLGVTWRQDAEETIQVLTKYDKYNLLIVDHYALDHNWLASVRPYFANILVIDDLADRRLDCDVLLDQTFGRRVDDYQHLMPKYCKALLGARYALLRPQFAMRRQEAIIRRAGQSCTCDRILVSMGGMDPDDLTSFVLHGLEKIPWLNSVAVDVILGSNAPNIEEVKKNASRSKLSVSVHSGIDDMAEFMLKADLAVGAGGTTAWERCCLGLPTLMVITADNQKFLVKSLTSVGAAVNLGESSQLTAESFAEAVDSLFRQEGRYKKMVTAAFAICDGLGAERVAREIAKQPSRVYLRTATEQDCKLVFTWQSNPDMRKFCRNPKVPSWQEHQSWFYRSIKDGERELFIVESGDNSVGVLRLDRLQEKSDIFEVSILIGPEWQGLGVGLEALRYLRKFRPEVDFIAEVLGANIASKRLFIAAGFTPLDETWFLSKSKT